MKNKIILIMFFSLLLVGFGKQCLVFAEEGDIIPPTVISSYPESGSKDVDVDIQPTLIFSEELDRNTINSTNIQLRTYTEKASDSIVVSTVLTYNEGNVVSFILNSNLDYNKQYYFFVGTGVKDIAGNKIVDTWYHADRDYHEFTTVSELIKDTTSPVIILNGDSVINLKVGETYTEQGATASDDIDGDITSSIEKNGDVDTSTVGTYTITYDVKDLAGNIAEQVVRTVNISENSTGGGIDPIPFSIEGNVTLDGNGCSIEDTDGVMHTFSNDTSSDELLGVCALVVAEQDGLIEDFEFIDFGWGLFLESINGVKTGDNWDPSWSLYYNGESSLVGLTDLSVKNGDTISLIFTSFNDSKEYEKVVLHILHDEEIEENPSSGGGSGGGSTQKVFSVPEAISFLSLQQDADESLGGDMYFDWVSVAVGAEGDSDLETELINYLKSNPLDSSIITDNERRAMALMALGINPYNGTEVDYIKKIVDSFDGTQLGEDDLVNDDIFGLIVLQNAGYDEDDEIIKKIIEFIIDNQESDGSFGSIDMTGAAIMALNDFDDIEGVSDAISSAEDYLIDEKESDGSFDNIYSTGWAIQALSLNNSYNDEVEDGIQYLADNQGEDGGVLDGSESMSNRIWATAYAIPAVLELSWNDILNDFDKPEEENTESNNSSGNSNELSDNQDDESVLSDEVVEITQNNLEEENNIVAPKRIYTMYDFLEPELPVETNEPSEDIITLNDQDIETLETEEMNLLQASAGNTNNKFIEYRNTISLIPVFIAMFLLGFVLGRKV